MKDEGSVWGSHLHSSSVSVLLVSSIWSSSAVAIYNGQDIIITITVTIIICHCCGAFIWIASLSSHDIPAWQVLVYR